MVCSRTYSVSANNDALSFSPVGTELLAIISDVRFTLTYGALYPKMTDVAGAITLIFSKLIMINCRKYFTASEF
ncbi:hypothetical protein SAMN05661096_03485 [Marivirga sericea]|uniref:Uncharacterized protein n=1 Tax=Marivirga sericea TaxID=1028 RepID=A0A1X7L423_9BACT|nr:hypothetical protein [Marivirga sericea]SMG48500.1 hypothetical protein SAMN05661096_03485 [Marivirga sericea]